MNANPISSKEKPRPGAFARKRLPVVEVLSNCGRQPHRRLGDDGQPTGEFGQLEGTSQDAEKALGQGG